MTGPRQDEDGYFEEYERRGFRFVKNLFLPSERDRFEVKKFFVVDTSVSANVRIASLSDQFMVNFFDITESLIEDTTVSAWRFIVRNSYCDGPIYNDIRRRDDLVLTLREIYQIIKSHQDILSKERQNIFYVRNKCGDIFIVEIVMSSNGWKIDSFARGKYKIGYRSVVFSHMSSNKAIDFRED